MLLIDRRRGFQLLCVERSQQKSIHRSADPRIFAERNRRTYGFLVSPPVAAVPNEGFFLALVLIDPGTGSGGKRDRDKGSSL